MLRRPILAKPPFHFIGKEIERKAQEGEDVSVLESKGPIRYEPGQTAKTRAADPALILRAKRYGLRQLSRESGENPRPATARSHAREGGDRAAVAG